jgi:hypothetical protein
MSWIVAGIQAIATFAWVFLVWRLMEYISRHSIAIYATRATDTWRGPSEKTPAQPTTNFRIFLQNLEDIELAGDFRVHVQVTPGIARGQQSVVPITKVYVYAGPSALAHDDSELDKGKWVLFFKELPAFDTWMFEVRTNQPVAKLDVGITEAKQRDVTVKEPEYRSLGTVSVEKLSLAPKQSSVLMGAERTPKLRTLFLTVAVAVVGYILSLTLLGSRSLWLILDRLGVGSPDAMFGTEATSWLASTFAISWVWDIVACIALAMLISVTYAFSLRQAAPIAQGYQSPTLLVSKKGQSVRTGD